MEPHSQGHMQEGLGDGAKYCRRDSSIVKPGASVFSRWLRVWDWVGGKDALCGGGDGKEGLPARNGRFEGLVVSDSGFSGVIGRVKLFACC